MLCTLKKRCFFICLSLLLLGASAQQRTDSLNLGLRHAKDTTRVNLLNEMGKALASEDPDSAITCSTQALQLARQLKWNKGLVTSNILIAYAYFNRSDFDSAIACYNRALSAAGKGYPGEVQQAYQGLGSIYLYKADYPKSLGYLFKALKAAEGRNDKRAVAVCYINIANVFIQQAELQKCFDYNLKALKIAETLNDDALKEKICYAMGSSYGAARDDEQSLAWFKKSLALNEKMNNKSGLAYAYSSIGSCCENLGRHAEALDNFGKATQIAVSIGDKRVEIQNISTMAFVYKTMKQYPKAIENYLKTIRLSKEIGIADIELEALGELTEIYKATHNDHEALSSYQAYIALRDTMMNQEKAKEIVRKEMNYELDKQQALARAENEKIQLKAAEDKRRQNLVVAVVLIVLLIVSIFSVFIYRSLRINKQKSRVIEQQKLLVESKNHEIEEKQKEILDSISYAQRIQRALLPPLQEVKNALPQSFVLFKPKDIVSGDFYWLANIEEQVLIAAADCTGHGVPGAFMSTIGTEKLNEAVKESVHAGTILSKVNRGIKKVLRQNSATDATRDGMDIALCSFKKGSNLLSYAGANRPLWIIRHNGTAIEEIKATKAPIGGFTDDEQLFETHSIELEPGDSLYIFSDGFADQFGQSNKKLMTKKFREVLVTISSQAMESQKDYLDQFIEDWKGTTEQTDDILVIGIKAA